MVINPIGTNLASLGNALGQGLSAPVNQALELLGQKKLMEIQNAQKNRMLSEQRAERFPLLSKYLGADVANFVLSQPEKVQGLMLANPGALRQLMQSQTGTEPITNDLMSSLGMSPKNTTAMEQIGFGEPGPDFKNMQTKGLQDKLKNQKQSEIDAIFADLFTPEGTKLARAKDARDAERLGLQHEKQSFAEKKFGFEQSKQFREEVSKAEAEADHTLALLGRQKELNKSGKLPHPLQTKFLRDFGMEWALNPEGQEFAGLEKEFLKGARSIFGGRVTNFEMSQFLRGIPTLMQSKEGRDRIIRNLEIMAKLKKLKADVTHKILKKSEFPPANLSDLVAQKSKNKREALLNDFVTGGQTLKDMPNAAANSGKLLKTPEGTWKRSNGKDWVDISQEEVDKLTGGQ